MTSAPLVGFRSQDSAYVSVRATGDRVLVGDRVALVVGHRCAIDAAQVAGLGEGLAVAGVADVAPDPAVAAPLPPRLVLGHDEAVVIVVVPGGCVEVFVGGG